MLTRTEARALRSLLARAELPDPSPAPADLAPGDLAQLQPLCDRVFGGALLYVAEIHSPYEIRGPLLWPHRGGCREAWQRRNPAELVRIGRAPWPDPEYSRRRWCYQPNRCPLTGR